MPTGKNAWNTYQAKLFQHKLGNGPHPGEYKPVDVRTIKKNTKPKKKYNKTQAWYDFRERLKANKPSTLNGTKEKGGTISRKGKYTRGPGFYARYPHFKVQLLKTEPETNPSLVDKMRVTTKPSQIILMDEVNRITENAEAGKQEMDAVAISELATKVQGLNRENNLLKMKVTMLQEQHAHATQVRNIGENLRKLDELLGETEEAPCGCGCEHK